MFTNAVSKSEPEKNVALTDNNAIKRVGIENDQ